MDISEIELRIRKLVALQLDIELDLVKIESKIMEDLGGDSLDVVEMVMLIEDEFGIEIPDKEAETLKSLRAAVDYVATKLSSK